MMEFVVNSIAETNDLACRIAPRLPKSALITLSGDLGAGKTTFTKALGKALGVKKVINSPTFTILKSYPMADGRILYHMDVYRMEGIEQDLGFEEVFEDEGVCVVEWPEYISKQLPDHRLEINIHRLDETRRCFIIQGHGEEYERIAEAL